MRIGLIAPPWIPTPPPGYGGTEEVVDGLARGLTALGHDVVLAAGPGSTCPVPRLAATEHRGAADDEVVDVTDWRRERDHAVLAYASLRDVDIIHDHTVQGPVLDAGTPRVMTVHGAFEPALVAHYRRMPASVGVIAISHHQASTSAGMRVDAVIHHGIDVEAIPYGSGEGGYLAFLGRMSPDKGVREAITVARAAGMPLRIATKIWEPDEHAYYDDVIRPLLGPDIEFTGELSRADKYAFLGRARALMNPIQWPEPFGMAMIEAMASGTPVIVTPRGSALEIIEEGVTGFIRATLPELTEAVEATGRLDRRLVRARQEARFSLRRVALDHVAFYEEWLGDLEGGANVRRVAAS